jgi:hypothetical protein
VRHIHDSAYIPLLDRLVEEGCMTCRVWRLTSSFSLLLDVECPMFPKLIT